MTREVERRATGVHLPQAEVCGSFIEGGNFARDEGEEMDGGFVIRESMT